MASKTPYSVLTTIRTGAKRFSGLLKGVKRLCADFTGLPQSGFPASVQFGWRWFVVREGSTIFQTLTARRVFFAGGAAWPFYFVNRWRLFWPPPCEPRRGSG